MNPEPFKDVEMHRKSPSYTANLTAYLCLERALFCYDLSGDMADRIRDVMDYVYDNLNNQELEHLNNRKIATADVYHATEKKLS